MAVRLGDLLVQHGLITDKQLKEGLRSQQLYGGRLGTNLVELGYVSETKLAELLSQQLGMPCARAAEFDAVAAEVTKLVPVATVEKYRVVPLSLEKRRLRLAMADPTDLRVVDELAFATGLAIEPVVAPEVLVLYAMEKLYGIPRNTRYLRLHGVAQTEFEVIQAGQQTAGVRELGALGEGKGNVQVEDRGQFFALERDDFTATRFTMEEAAAKLASVEQHGDIFEVARRFFSWHFDQMAAFVVRGEQVLGWVQVRCRISDEEMRKLAVPVAKSALLGEVLNDFAIFAGVPPESALDAKLFQALGIPEHREVLCLPIVVNAKPICALLGSGPQRGELKDRLMMFDTFAKKLSYAIQILYLKQRILGRAL